jgi:hypothetical protein
MMSLMQWQKLTARMTAKTVACADGAAGVALPRGAVAVVLVKEGSMIFGGMAAAALIIRLLANFFRGLVHYLRKWATHASHILLS